MKTYSAMTRSETVNEVLDFLIDKVPHKDWHHVAGTLYLMLDECERAEMLSNMVDIYLIEIEEIKRTIKEIRNEL